MIVELGIGVLTVGALGYMIYWQRKRVKLAKMREEQARKLKRLKREFERGR